MSLLGNRSDKLEKRPRVVSFCDHCGKLVQVERLSTAYGIKWLCEVTTTRKAIPVETLSDVQVQQIKSHEAELLDRQVDAELIEAEEEQTA